MLNHLAQCLAHCRCLKSGPAYSFTFLERGVLLFPLPACPSGQLLFFVQDSAHRQPLL